MESAGQYGRSAVSFCTRLQPTQLGTSPGTNPLCYDRRFLCSALWNSHLWTRSHSCQLNTSALEPFILASFCLLLSLPQLPL